MKLKRITAILLAVILAVFSIPLLSSNDYSYGEDYAAEEAAEETAPVTASEETEEISEEAVPVTDDFSSEEVLSEDAYEAGATVVDSGHYSPDYYLYDDPADVDWVLYSDGTLKLTGKGVIGPYKRPAGVKRAIVGEGVELYSGVSQTGYFDGCTTIESAVLPASTKTIGGFKGCTSLKTVTIPANCAAKRLSISAFHGCTKLTGITIPSGVQYINDEAFYGCSKLSSITIPKSVTYTGPNAFSASGIKKITIEGEFENVNSFSDTDNVTFIFKGTKVGNGTIGKAGCTNVVLGSKIKKIESKAFSDCESLENVIFLNDYDYNSKLFASAQDLRIFRKNGSGTVALEEMVGGGKKVTIPSSVQGYRVTEIGDYAFDSNKYVRTVKLSSKVKKIGAYAFYNCSKLNSLTIKDGVTSIGKFAFYGCNSLDSIKIPDTVTTIGTRAFWNCYSLTSLKIPDSVTSIGANAFESCNGLTSISIGNTSVSTSLVEVSPVQVAYAASSSKKVKIKSSAFKNCKKLKKVTIGKKVNSIGSKAFYGCSSLKIIKIKSKTLKSSKVGSKAFTKTSSKVKVYVPKSKLRTYKKMLTKKGLSKRAVFKKI